MWSLETTSSYSETTFQFVSQHSETNSGELLEVMATAGALEVAATAGSCSGLPAMPAI